MEPIEESSSGAVLVAERGRVEIETLYAAHIGEAVRLAFLLTGDRAQADDVAQEAFVRILARFGNLRRPESFRAYLRSTVVNLCRKQWRKRSSEAAAARRERGLARGGSSLAPDIEQRDELWGALQSLPTRQRSALVLRYYEDLSEAETADVMRCSLGAVKQLVNRGLKALREEGAVTR